MNRPRPFIPAVTATTGERGFTLLEALVAVVVISIGLLGVLGLQTVAIVNTQISESRSQASTAADDIGERIRANPAGANNGDYNAIANPYDATDDTPPSPDCLSQKCSPKQMAEFDAWEWGRALFEALRGRGYVDCVSTATPSNADPCREYEIIVVWNERTAPDAALGSSANDDLCEDDRFEDRCFVTVIRP